mgnify:FL=1
MTYSVPGETTMCNFWHLLEEHELNNLFFNVDNRVMEASGHNTKGGTIVCTTNIDIPNSKSN